MANLHLKRACLKEKTEQPKFTETKKTDKKNNKKNVDMIHNYFTYPL